MQRHVMVDGKVRTDKTYPSGFMGRLRARCGFGCMSNVMAIASYRLNYCLPESCRCCVNSEDWGEFPPSLWYQGALPSPQYQGWWGQGNASQVPIEVFFFLLCFSWFCAVTVFLYAMFQRHRLGVPSPPWETVAPCRLPRRPSGPALAWTPSCLLNTVCTYEMKWLFCFFNQVIVVRRPICMYFHLWKVLICN